MTSQKLTCQETVEFVTDYLEAALIPELETLFEQHLAGCVHCTAYLEQMRQTTGLLRRLTDETMPEETKQQLLAKFRKQQEIQ